MNRRKILGFGALVSAGVFGIYSTYKFIRNDPVDIVVAILIRRMAGMNVHRSSFEIFAKDYIEYRADAKKMLSFLSVASFPLQFITPYNLLEKGASIRRLEDNVVSLYLLSTDFFAHNADTNREISYLSFYDPYTTICRNPLANKG